MPSTPTKGKKTLQVEEKVKASRRDIHYSDTNSQDKDGQDHSYNWIDVSMKAINTEHGTELAKPNNIFQYQH